MQFNQKKLDWLCERGILLLVAGMIMFAPLAYGSVDEWAWVVLQTAGMVVLLFWAARLWLARRVKFLWPPLAWVALTFLLYAVIRYFTCGIEYVARLELLQVLIFIFLFFCIITNLRGQEEMEIVTGALIGVGTFAAGYGIYQMLTHSRRVWAQFVPAAGRASGPYISPNHLADLLAMLLPLALAFLLVGRMKVLTRIMIGYAAVVMAVGLAMTFSRGGWIAASFGLLLVPGILLFHSNHRLRAAILIAVMLLAGTVFVRGYLSRTDTYAQRVKSPNASAPGVLDVSSRLEMWQAAVRMWKDHFWFGVGPAQYDYFFREYRPESFQLRPSRSHNDYLNLLADWGVVGGVIVFAGFVIFLVQLRQTWPHVRREENAFGSGQSNRFAFFLGSMAGLAALAAHSVVDFNLHIPANALVGVVLLALVTSNIRHVSDQYWVRPRMWLKVGMTVLFIGVAGLMLWQSWRLGREARWLARADRQPVYSTACATALGNAFACEPKNFNTAYEIGECFRIQSFTGGTNYIEQAHTAMLWYDAAKQLNPRNGYNYLRSAMCLDWIGETNKSEALYLEAEARDPNGYFTVANLGWHYVQINDYAEARRRFLRSAKLWNNNPIANNYIPICDRKLEELAGGTPRN